MMSPQVGLIIPARQLPRDVRPALPSGSALAARLPRRRPVRDRLRQSRDGVQADEERDRGEHDLRGIIAAQQAGSAKAADCAQVPAHLSFVMTLIVIGGGQPRSSAPYPRDHMFSLTASSAVFPTHRNVPRQMLTADPLPLPRGHARHPHMPMRMTASRGLGKPFPSGFIRPGTPPGGGLLAMRHRSCWRSRCR